MKPYFKSYLILFLTIFSFHVFADSSEEDLVRFWMNLRFQNCDDIYATVITTKNPYSLTSLRKGQCSTAVLTDSEKKETQDCFKAIDKSLQISITNSADAQPAKFNCKGNPNYTSYLSGDKTNLKPVEKIYAANIICKADDDKKFLYASVDNKSTCTKKFNCSKKFKFGSESLESGTYYLRCNKNAASQSDCDSVSLVSCEGQEHSYAKLTFGGISKANSVYVAPTVGTGN